MALKGGVFTKALASALSLGIAAPSFASIDALSRAMVDGNYAAAAPLAEALHAQGVPYGSCILGVMSYHKLGPVRDPATTRKLASTCVGQTPDGEAMYAGMLQWGYGGPPDSRTAGAMLERLVSQDGSGKINSDYSAWLLFNFDGVPRPANRTQLIQLHAEKARSLGYQYAFSRLGAVHDDETLQRLKTTANATLRQEAFGWTRRAAGEDNDRRAMVQYLEGTGLDKKLGDQTMMNVKLGGAHIGMGELAYEFYIGRKLPKNLPEARYWAENGAKHQSAWSTYVLGVMTRDGQGGLAANPQRAVELLTQAHGQRADIAAADLAGMYATGRHIPQDLVKARQWLQRGHTETHEVYKAMYAERLRYFDESKARADAWARQQAQQRKFSGEETFLLGLAAFGAAIASQIDWSRVGEARSSGGRGATSYSEPFDFDKHQKQVYCTSYAMTSMSAFSLGGC